jgi:hypothetical protein
VPMRHTERSCPRPRSLLKLADPDWLVAQAMMR